MAATLEPLMRVVSYNIHQCVGRDGHCDPSRVAAVLQDLHADVYGLQEVGACRFGEVPLQQLEYLAAATGLVPLPGPTLLREDTGESYGNALLTRWPVENLAYFDLSMPNYEPRGALSATLRVDGRRVNVCVTHLGLGAAERRKQIQRLLNGLQSAEVTILLGDFNEWWPWSRVLGYLRQYFSKYPTPRTFPSGLPLLALDRIWVKSHECVATLDTSHLQAASVASDHLPLYADLVLSPNPENES